MFWDYSEYRSEEEKDMVAVVASIVTIILAIFVGGRGYR
jgi:hypothetical protein